MIKTGRDENVKNFPNILTEKLELTTQFCLDLRWLNV